MASDSFKVKNSLHIKGNTTSTTEAGDIRFDDSDGKLKAHNGTTEEQIIRSGDLADLNYDNSTSGLTATDPKAALDEVVTSIGQQATDLQSHIDDAADAHHASAIGVTPTGNLTANETQAALVELQESIDTTNTTVATKASQAALDAHINDTDSAHAASAITATDKNSLPSKVQTVLNDLFVDMNTKADESTVGAHIANTANPHSVTAAQVGNTTAQWNANKIQGATVDAPTAAENGKTLVYNSAGNIFEYGNAGGGGGSTGVNDNPDPLFQKYSPGDWTVQGVGDHVSFSVDADSEAIHSGNSKGAATITFDNTGGATDVLANGYGRTFPISKKSQTDGFIVVRMNYTAGLLDLAAGDLKFSIQNPDDLTQTFEVAGLDDNELPGVAVGEVASIVGKIYLYPGQTSIFISIVGNFDSLVSKAITFNGPNLGPDEGIQGISIQDQSSSINGSATTGPGANVTGAHTSSDGSGLYSYDSGTGVYTALKDIKADLSVSLRIGTTQSQATIIVNGLSVASDFSDKVSGYASASWSGDILKNQTFHFSNSVGVGSADYRIVSVHAAYTSNPVLSSVEAMNKNVRFDYTLSSQAAASGVTTRLNFNTKVTDTHNAVSPGASWEFVAPARGTLNLSSRIRYYSNTNWTIGETASLDLYKNGGLARQLDFYEFTSTPGTGIWVSLKGTTDIELEKGDTISLHTYHNSGATETLDSSYVTGHFIPTLKQYTTLGAERSEIFVDTGNGHGSTATKVRRFSNIRTNVGTAITYTDNATDGSTFTINEPGTYTVQYSDYKSTASVFIAVTVDVSSTTTNANALTYATGRRIGVNTAGAGLAGTASWTGYLPNGSVVRAMNDGTANSTDSFSALSITRVG